MKRPLSVTLVACVYLAVGVIGFVFHFHELLAGHHDAVGIELTEFVAILCGAFLLRGHTGRAGWRSRGLSFMWS
jgi:hypothetical protein